MNNSSLKTTSRQLYDTTISGQHPVSNQVTQSESKTDNTDSVSNLVSNSVSTAGARAYARACACAREGDGDKSIIGPDELEAIRKAYVTNVGQQMTAMVAREIEEAVLYAGSPAPLEARRHPHRRRARRRSRRLRATAGQSAGKKLVAKPGAPV